MADPEILRVSLKYEGPDVNDGSMAIADMISALQGFANAYEKIATVENLSHDHRLRLVGLTRSSAELHISVLEWVAANAMPLRVIGGAGVFIVSTILAVIKIKKHAEGKPVSVSTRASTDNQVTVNNHLKVSLEVNARDYEVFKSELIDGDLNKITYPLREKYIDDVVLAVPQLNANETIAASDRDYFRLEKQTVTVTREIWLEGFLDSLSKSRNRGTFYLKGGRSVPYKLASEKPSDLYYDFAYNGPVRVRSLAHLDNNLDPILIEIYEIQRVQGNLFYK